MNQYWNVYTETMPREQLQKTEFQYFKNLFSYGKSHSGRRRQWADQHGPVENPEHRQ